MEVLIAVVLIVEVTNMKTSILIAKLIDIQAVHGDLPVYIRDYEGFVGEFDNIDLLYPENKITWRQDRTLPPESVLLDF